MTNSAGRSYTRSGDVYNEIAAPEYTSGLHFTDRQFEITYTVKMYKMSGENKIAATESDLAGIADTYKFRVDPSSLVKVSQTETTALGTKHTTGQTPTNDAPTSGALAATADQLIDITETIVVTSLGGITFAGNTKTPAEMLAGVTFKVYGGLQVNSENAQPFSDTDEDATNDIRSIYAGSKLEVSVGHMVSTTWTALS